MQQLFRELKRRNVYRMAATYAAVVFVSGPTTDVRGQATPEFDGTWTLVSWTAQLPNGETIHPFGEQATGVLVYGRSGRMSVQIMGADRPRAATSDPLSVSAEKMQAAYQSYLAYWGTYETHREEGTVTHFLQGSLFPNWVGTEQVRTFEFDGENRLTLRTPPIASSATDGKKAEHVLVWERDG